MANVHGLPNCHGIVAYIVVKGKKRWFTGVGFSNHLNCAKVFSTKKGAKSAVNWFKGYTEDMGQPMPDKVWATFGTSKVALGLLSVSESESESEDKGD